MMPPSAPCVACGQPVYALASVCPHCGSVPFSSAPAIEMGSLEAYRLMLWHRRPDLRPNATTQPSSGGSEGDAAKGRGSRKRGRPKGSRSKPPGPDGKKEAEVWALYEKRRDRDDDGESKLYHGIAADLKPTFPTITAKQAEDIVRRIKRRQKTSTA